MKKTLHCFLLVGYCMLLREACFSQSMTNTSSVLTLTSTCLNPTLASGSYTLNLQYDDPDNGPTNLNATVTVVSNGTVATLTQSGSTFPTPATNGSFSIHDYDIGTLALTGGPTPSILFWYHDPDGTIRFNCQPLPIWFEHFTGTQSSSTMQLAWQTDMEQNTTVIEVYRSTTGSNFYKIGQVTAAGNSSIVRNYSFTDNNPGSSDYYYLKMLNSQGTQAIYSNTIHVTCSGCSFTPPTAVNCPYTINGPDHLCNIETYTAYSLSSAVPDYSTITWSVDVPSAASVITYPNFDRTQVSLLMKGLGGAVVLRANLSGCSNVITKSIIVGSPTPVLSTEQGCPTLWASVTNTPGATGYTWFLDDQTIGSGSINPTSVPSWVTSIGGGHTFRIGVNYDNICGTSNPAISGTFVCTGPGGTPPDPGPAPVVAPNPSNGIVTIAVDISGAHKKKVYLVKVVDGRGVVRRMFRYPGGLETVSVNLGGLHSGLYTVQVFDNKRWTSSQVILTK
jgi:hypothetical protein